MADERDPILESRLREALHREAAAIQLTLRADEIRRVGAERRRAMRTRRLSFLAAAAVVVVAGGAIALSLSMRTPQTVAQSPSPSAATSPLASRNAASDATPDANGLMPYAALEDALVVNGVPNPTVQGEHPAAEPGDAGQTWTVGTVEASSQVGIAISCAGGSVTVGVVAGSQHLAPTLYQCDTAYDLISTDGTLTGTMNGPGGPGTIVVSAMPGVRWRLVAGVATAPTSPTSSPRVSVEPSALAGLPTSAELLATAGQGAVQLQSLEGDAAPQDQVVTFGPVPHRGALAVVVACYGGDSVGVAINTEVLPSTDPGGSDSLFSGRAPCYGTPQSPIPWDGWNSVILNTGAHAGLSVPAGISYRAILVDTSAVAGDGETTPVADGLPTVDHLSAIRSDVQGPIVTIHEELSPSSGASSPVQAADIRADGAIKVLIACAGGTADLALGNVTGNSAATLGGPVCDGTVQEFDADTVVAGGTHAASLLVTASAGTTWRLVVWDMTSTTHPNPTVPCGSASGLKQAPLPTLFAGGKAIGTLPGYYTSSWGTTHDDGAPVVPSAWIDVKADTPLQLRVSGDVCAGNWTILYGTPRAGGLGIDSVGALALRGDYFATTDRTPENRIDLQSLPPGDWVLEITLDFENGSGVGLLRVHAS
jgi:hypothetical protein